MASNVESQDPRLEQVYDVDPKAAVIAGLSGHVGKDKAISGEALLKRANTWLHQRNGDKIAYTTLKDVIEQLRSEGWAIGSNKNVGYWLIDGDDEFREMMNRWDSKCQRIREKQRRLAQAYYGDRSAVFTGGK